MRSLVWFRGNDLRLRDQAALRAGLDQGEVVLVYVFDPKQWAADGKRGATYRQHYLWQNVDCLRQDIEALGAQLLLLEGEPAILLPWLVEHGRIGQLLTQRQTDPVARRLNTELERKLSVPLRLFDGETLVLPGSMRTTTGGAYSVFTAFARAVGQHLDVGQPLPRPARLPALPTDFAEWLATATRQAKTDCRWLDELPKPLIPTNADDLQAGGERAALQRLKHFVNKTGEEYALVRDRMDLEGTSRLSADLKFGTISPKQLWNAANKTIAHDESRTRFLNQLIWREFAHSTLWDRPELLTQPFQPRFARFPWRNDERGYLAWVEGKTGYPIVDAAARQLLREGFVHNRARMIAASFLAKDLLVDFRQGERHYLDWLIDGDPALNDLGWQWSSGSGCDAQPYFRIFNPTTQAERFDPEGAYVRRYVEELAAVPTRHIHAPWLAPSVELAVAAVRIGRDYPAPIVEHASARKRFLAIASEHFGNNSLGRGASKD